MEYDTLKSGTYAPRCGTNLLPLSSQGSQSQMEICYMYLFRLFTSLWSMWLTIRNTLLGPTFGFLPRKSHNISSKTFTTRTFFKKTNASVDFRRQSGRRVALTAHPDLMSRLKKEQSYTSTPPLSLHGLFHGKPFKASLAAITPCRLQLCTVLECPASKLFGH